MEPSSKRSRSSSPPTGRAVRRSEPAPRRSINNQRGSFHEEVPDRRRRPGRARCHRHRRTCLRRSRYGRRRRCPDQHRRCSHARQPRPPRPWHAPSPPSWARHAPSPPSPWPHDAPRSRPSPPPHVIVQGPFGAPFRRHYRWLRTGGGIKETSPGVRSSLRRKAHDAHLFLDRSVDPRRPDVRHRRFRRSGDTERGHRDAGWPWPDASRSASPSPSPASPSPRRGLLRQRSPSRLGTPSSLPATSPPWLGPPPSSSSAASPPFLGSRATHEGRPPFRVARS